MSIKPKTIDNLGIDSHNAYALKEDFFDPDIIQYSSISNNTDVIISSDQLNTELNKILGIDQKNQSFANFVEPQDLTFAKKELFSTYIIPSLGTDERKLDRKNKIKKKKKFKKAKLKLKEQIEEEKEEEEKESLISFFNCLDIMEKDLIEINAKRSQYHKG